MWDELAEPFPVKQIHWRLGATTGDKKSGIALAYLDARDVMDRLDSVVGPEGWCDQYEETRSGRIICELGITIDGRGHVYKSDGAGDTAVEGEKGAMSDAFKRAAVKWGIGRYLYRLGTSWHPIKAQGKSYVLDGFPELPEWAIPSPKTSLKEHTQAVRDNWASVAEIKNVLSHHLEHEHDDSNLSVAAEAWFELDDKTKRLLWLSTRDGGIWEPGERKIMKEDLRAYRTHQKETA